MCHLPQLMTQHRQQVPAVVSLSSPVRLWKVEAPAMHCPTVRYGVLFVTPVYIVFISVHNCQCGGTDVLCICIYCMRLTPWVLGRCRPCLVACLLIGLSCWPAMVLCFCFWICKSTQLCLVLLGILICGEAATSTWCPTTITQVAALAVLIGYNQHAAEGRARE